MPANPTRTTGTDRDGLEPVRVVSTGTGLSPYRGSPSGPTAQRLRKTTGTKSRISPGRYRATLSVHGDHAQQVRALRHAAKLLWRVCGVKFVSLTPEPEVPLA